MKRTAFRIVCCMMVAIAALLAGCGNDEKAALQDQNLILTDRVAELEYRLQEQQAQNASSQTYTPTQPLQPTLENTSVYLVVQGDTLWNIAKKQLGSGARYKEILALNPNVSANKPLAIGTKLTLPPR